MIKFCEIDRKGKISDIIFKSLMQCKVIKS